MTRHSWRKVDLFVRHEHSNTRFRFDIGYEGIWVYAWVMDMSMGIEHAERMGTFQGHDT